MTFNDFLDEACESAGLPNMAKLLLLSTLTDVTKSKVMKLSADELGKILKDAIDQIDHGSIESVDALVKKALKG